MASDTEYKAFLNTHNSWATRYMPLIRRVLQEYKTANPDKPVPSVSLVLATINQESAGECWATRFEPNFKTWLTGRVKQDPKLFKTFGRAISRETELVLRSTSFGPMQLMGQTLRELGFTGQYLTEACDPNIGITYGIRFLARLLARHGNEDAAIASFNAGSPRRAANGKYVNQEYVDSVKQFKSKWDYILDKEWLV